MSFRPRERSERVEESGWVGSLIDPSVSAPQIPRIGACGTSLGMTAGGGGWWIQRREGINPSPTKQNPIVAVRFNWAVSACGP